MEETSRVNAWLWEGGSNVVEETGRKPASWAQDTYKKVLER